MSVEETLIFVDGENLVFRYQEMIAAGRKPALGNIHIPDCFIWNQSVLNDHIWNLKRVAYHTSVIGDDNKVREVRTKIAATTFRCDIDATGKNGESSTSRTGQIVPFVRKKASKSKKESICDVGLTVDIMRSCYRDHADIIWLFSGDGDFISLISEIIHSGKLSYVSAFSSGLCEEIPFVVDEFLPLDKYFFADESHNLDSDQNA
jgi:uncharacterized LabA/DUF88 family protein